MDIKFSYANCTGIAGNCLFPNTAIVKDINELHKYMKYDYTFIEFKNNYRDSKKFIRSEYATFDVDNDHSENKEDWIQIADIPKIFENVWCLVITSRNHMKPKLDKKTNKPKTPRPKFHIVFRMNEVKDAKVFSDFMHRVQKKYRFFDPLALDAGRFMFGSEDSKFYEFGGSLNLSEFMDLEDKNDKKFKELDIDFLTPIEEGYRNGTMSKLAGKILKRFGDTQEAYECYLKQADRCVPSLDDSELDTIWRSAQSFYQRISKQIGYIAPEDFGTIEWDDPTPLDEVDNVAFPVNALPDNIKKYVEELSESTQTPLDMAASSALAILAVCSQGKYKISGKSDWIEPLNLYTLIVAEPSERKSAVISSMVKPLNEYEEFYNTSNAALFQENKIAKNILKGQERIIEDRAIKGKATKEEISDIARKVSEFKEINPIKLYVDDITTEKLIKVLKDNNSKAAIISSEGGLFDIMSGMYSKTVNIDVFLKSYSGDTLRVDRIGRDSEAINNPALTILLTVQPTVVRNVMQNAMFKGRGLTARFLYSCPTSSIGSRIYRSKCVTEESYENYKKAIFSLLQDEQENPVLIKLSDDADKELETFAEWLEPKLKGEYSEIADWAGKLVGTVLRISGILARANTTVVNEFLADTKDIIVSKDIMQKAILIGHYYLEHAKSAYFVLAGDYLVKECRGLLKAIRTNQIKEFSRRDAMRLYSSLRDVNHAQKVIDHFVEYGYAQVKQETIQYKQGRPNGQKYIVNPKVFDSK